MPRIATDESLAAFLCDRDLPCPGCGYNLRCLTSAHCPECRQHLVLTVSLAEPPIVQFALAVIGLAVRGASADITLLCVIVASMERFGFLRGEGAMPLWMPAAILRSASRRWFRARSRSGRRLLVLACWLASLITASIDYADN